MPSVRFSLTLVFGRVSIQSFRERYSMLRKIQSSEIDGAAFEKYRKDRRSNYRDEF